jgi:hypothetical protein
MRGQYVPFIYHAAGRSTAAYEEIRRAIDEVRFSAEPARSANGSVQGEPVPQEALLVVPRFVFVDPIDRVDGDSIGPIRGQAPLAFFRWFEELRSRLEDQQTMLNRCHFEEAD